MPIPPPLSKASLVVLAAAAPFAAISAQAPELVADINGGGQRSDPISKLAASYSSGDFLFAVGEDNGDPEEALEYSKERVWAMRDGGAAEVFQADAMISTLFVVGGVGYFTDVDSLYRVSDNLSVVAAIAPVQHVSTFGNGGIVFTRDSSTVYMSGESGFVYRVDPTGVDSVRGLPDMSRFPKLNRANTVPYGSGVAFAAEVRDTLWLLGIEEGGAEVLASVPDYGSLRGVEALYTLEDGLLLVIDEQPLAYRPADGTLDTLLLDGERREFFTTGNAGAQGVLAYLPGEGFSLVADLSGSATRLLDAPYGGSLFDTEPINVVGDSDGLAWTYQDEDDFEDYLVVSDGTREGTATPEPIAPFPGPLSRYGAFAYFRDGGRNGFDMTLRAIELRVGRVTNLYAAPVTLERFQNIDPVTVRNDSLYFWSDFDESVGGELYRLPVPSARGVDTSSSATAAIARGAYALAVSHETARVAHDVSLPVELIVSDAAGRVVGRASGLTNADISLPRLPGAIGFVTAWVDGQRVTARHLAAQP